MQEPLSLEDEPLTFRNCLSLRYHANRMRRRDEQNKGIIVVNQNLAELTLTIYSVVLLLIAIYFFWHVMHVIQTGKYTPAAPTLMLRAMNHVA